MKGTTKLLVIVVSVLIASVAGLLLAEWLLPPLAGTGMQGMSGFYLRMKVILTSVNMAFCLIIAGTYLSLYSEVKSRFTLGLVFVTFAMLVYAATSNPLIHALSGFCLSGLGPYTMIPDLFAMAALGGMFYLSDP
jgi:hypothetical protein